MTAEIFQMLLHKKANITAAVLIRWSTKLIDTIDCGYVQDPLAISDRKQAERSLKWLKQMKLELQGSG